MLQKKKKNVSEESGKGNSSLMPCVKFFDILSKLQLVIFKKYEK